MRLVRLRARERLRRTPVRRCRRRPRAMAAPRPTASGTRRRRDLADVAAHDAPVAEGQARSTRPACPGTIHTGARKLAIADGDLDHVLAGDRRAARKRRRSRAAALSHVSWVIGFGSSCSHALFACRPSPIRGSGGKTISRPSSATGGSGGNVRRDARDAPPSRRCPARGRCATPRARTASTSFPACGCPRRLDERARIAGVRSLQDGQHLGDRACRRRAARYTAAASSRCRRRRACRPHASSGCAPGTCHVERAAVSSKYTPECSTKGTRPIASSKRSVAPVRHTPGWPRARRAFPRPRHASLP